MAIRLTGVEKMYQSGLRTKHRHPNSRSGRRAEKENSNLKERAKQYE